MSARAQAHQRYYTRDGTLVPGVTTVLGILEKHAIHPWIAKITREGKDWMKVRDEAGEVGTLTHHLIMCDLSGRESDTSDYSQNQIDQAQNAYSHYRRWKRGHQIQPILVETPLVSERGFGGTPDLFALIDDVATLIDVKTGGVWPEHYHQVAAYKQLLFEHNHMPVEEAKILRIPRSRSETSEEIILGDLSASWGIFKACLRIYQLQKEL